MVISLIFNHLSKIQLFRSHQTISLSFKFPIENSNKTIHNVIARKFFFYCLLFEKPPIKKYI